MLRSSVFLVLWVVVTALPFALLPQRDTVLARKQLGIDRLSHRLERARKNYVTNTQHPLHAERIRTMDSHARRLAKRSTQRRELNGDSTLNAERSSSCFDKRDTNVDTAGWADLVDNVNSQRPSLMDYRYLLPVSFGSPQQKFPMLLDTGSADLWVFAENENITRSTYKPSKSSTYGTNSSAWKIAYGAAAEPSVSGYVAWDTVTLGGLDAGTTRFAVATKAQQFYYSINPTGILGLAFSSTSDFYPHYTPFENLIATDAISAPYFALYLNRGIDAGVEYDASASTSEVSGGQITFGMLPSLVSNGSLVDLVFHYYPVTMTGLWQIEMQGMSISGNLVPGTGAAVALDSGAANTLLPFAVAEAFYAHFGGKSIGGGSYTVPTSAINASTAVGFVFGSTTYAVRPSDLVDHYTDDTLDTVIMSITAVNWTTFDQVTPLGLLGDAFLKNVVTVFSYAGGTGESDFNLSGPSVGFYSLSLHNNYSIAQNEPQVVDSDYTPSSGTQPATATVTNSINFSYLEVVTVTTGPPETATVTRKT